MTLAQAKRRAAKARRFPDNTCGASRHLHIMANYLAAGKPYCMFTEEPQHCAESIYAVIAALWEARTELAKVKDKPRPHFNPNEGFGPF